MATLAAVDSTSNSRIEAVTKYDMASARTTRNFNPVADECVRIFDLANNHCAYSATMAGDDVDKACSCYAGSEAGSTTVVDNKIHMMTSTYNNNNFDANAPIMSTIYRDDFYNFPSQQLARMPLLWSLSLYDSNRVESLPALEAKPNGFCYLFNSGNDDYYKTVTGWKLCRCTYGTYFHRDNCFCLESSGVDLPADIMTAWENGEYVMPYFDKYQGNAGSRSLITYRPQRYHLALSLTTDKFKQFSITGGSYDNTMTTTESSFKTIFSPVHCFAQPNYSSIGYTPNPFLWAWATMHDPDIDPANAYKSAVFSPSDIYVIISSNNPPTCIVKKEALSRWFSFIGVPLAFNDTDIQKDFAEIPDFDPDQEWEDPSGPERGQQTNVRHDWTGAGDNTEDSFSQRDPHRSLSSVCYHYTTYETMLNYFRWRLYNDTGFDNIDIFKNNPLENVVACRWYPFDVYNHDTANCEWSDTVQCGKVEMGVGMYKIQGDYNIKLHLGDFTFDEYFGGFPDYKLTLCDVFLPYIGWKSLNLQSVMGRQVHFDYLVDFNTGSCACMLTSTADDITRLESIYEGKMGIEIPILSSNYAENVRNGALAILKGAISLAGAAAGGAFVGGPVGAIAGAVASGAATVTDVATMEEHQQMGGALDGTLPMYLPQNIIVRITRPIKSESDLFQARHGYRANYSCALSEISGFVQVDDPKIDFECSEEEREQIKSLMKEGIYL